MINYKELTFGIELEFTGITRSAACKVISGFFGNMIVQHLGGVYDTYQTADPISGKLWKIQRDSSIRTKKKNGNSIVPASDLYSCELVTPILHYEDISQLQEIVRNLRKSNSLVDSSCGIHVHIGGDKFDTKHLKILCNIFYSKQNLVFRALNINTQRARYCKMLSEEYIKKLNDKNPTLLSEFSDIWYECNSPRFESRSSHYNSSRYHSLNLHNLLSNRQPTIEYRLFNSTLHAGKIKSYIQFCLLFTCKALNSNKASFKVTVPSTGNYKYSFRVFLLHLGMIGDEFKTARFHLLLDMDGNSAWRDRS